MKSTFIPVLLFATLLLSHLRSQTVWNLPTNWSDTLNPNGAWTLTNNGTAFTSQFEWTGESFSPPISGWAAAAGPPASVQVPIWYKATTSGGGGNDYLAGDIYVHAPFAGYTSAIWTSPINGTVSVSGSIWHLVNIGRVNDWAIYLRGASITGGTVSESGNSRASPVPFSSGSGGGAVLTNISVLVGDTIEFRLIRNSGSSDPTSDGVTLNIVSAIPEPSTHAALAGLAALGFAAYRRRQQQHTSSGQAPRPLVRR